MRGSWQKNDCGLPSHRKFKKLIRLGGAEAYALWSYCVIGACGAGSDGIVSEDMIYDAASDLKLDDAKVPVLRQAMIDAGLAHDRQTISKCHCKIARRHMDEHGLFIHDFSDWNPTNDQSKVPIERLRWIRKRELVRNRTLCEAIVARDGNRCRYCAVRVNFSDRRGRHGGTYDHLDPDLLDAPDYGNFLWNVVVACRTCNGQKKDRTPEEWEAAGGRKLLDPPDHLTESDLIRIESGTESDLTSRARDARDGTGRGGSGPDLIPIETREPALNGSGNGGRPLGPTNQDF